MRLSIVSVAIVACAGSAAAFTVPAAFGRQSVVVFSAVAGEPAAEIEAVQAPVEDIDVPTNLPSEVGMDYVPLATMLATGQFEEADQFTRDALIELAGSKAAGRNFVYFTEVKRIPSTDLATIERLWTKFSKGKFGYSVQKVSLNRCWMTFTALLDDWSKHCFSSIRQKKWRQAKGDFEAFCRKIGWTTTDGEVERKKKWFGASEFTYDLKKAPEGHLPLTSALRGTSLLKSLLNHPVWDNDDWQKEP